MREALRYLIDYDGLDKAVMPYYGKLHQRSLSTGVMGALPDQGYKLDVEKPRRFWQKPVIPTVSRRRCAYSRKTPS